MTFSFLRQKRGEGPKAAFPPDSTILSQIVDVAISRPSDFRLSRLVVGSSFFLFFFLFSFFFAHHATRNVRSGSVRRGRKRATIPPVSHLKDRDPTKISARTGRIWENLPRTKPLTGERDMETWRMRARAREREREGEKFHKPMQRVAGASRRFLSWQSRSFQKYEKICFRLHRDAGHKGGAMKRGPRATPMVPAESRPAQEAGTSAQRGVSLFSLSPFFHLLSSTLLLARSLARSHGHSFLSSGKPEATGSYAPSSWLAFTANGFLLPLPVYRGTAR